MAQSAFKITGTANFKDFKTTKFKELVIANSDSTDVTVSVVFGKDDNDGQSSITGGIYILQSVVIPVGASLCLGPMDFTNLDQRVMSDSLGETDYTLLIGTGNADHVISVFIDYAS